MNNIPLPALALRTPQPENPLDQMRRMVELRSLLKSAPVQQQIQQQQLQASQLENQQRAVQMQRERALADLYARGGQQSQSGGGQNGSTGNIPAPQGAAAIQQGQRPLSMPSDEEVLAAGGPGYGTAILKNMKELQKTNADLQEAYSKHQSEAQDYMGNVAAAIKAGGYDLNQANQLLDHAATLPGFGEQVRQFQQQIGGNPLMLRQMVDQAITMSPKQRELGAQEMTAQARKQQADIAARRSGMDVTGSQYVQPSPQSNGAGVDPSSQKTADPMNLRLTGGLGFEIP
jgi:hypothetical protein